MIKEKAVCEDEALERQIVQLAIEEATSQDQQDFAAQELLEMSTSQDATFFDQPRLSQPTNASCTKLFEEQRLSHGSLDYRSRYGQLVAQVGVPTGNLPGLQDFNHMSGWFSNKKKSYQNTFQLKNSKIEVSTKSATPAGTSANLPYTFHTPKGVENFERPIGHFKLDSRPKPVKLHASQNQYPLAKHQLSSPPEAQKDFLTSCLDLTNSAFLSSSIESSARRIEKHQAILTRPANSPKIDGTGQRSTQTSPKTMTPSHFIFPASLARAEDAVHYRQQIPVDAASNGPAVVLDDFISELRKLAGSSQDPLVSGIEGRKGPFIEIGSRPMRSKHRVKPPRQERFAHLLPGEAKNLNNKTIAKNWITGKQNSATSKNRLPLLGTHQNFNMETYQDPVRQRDLELAEELQSVQKVLTRLGTSSQPERPLDNRVCNDEAKDSAIKTNEYDGAYRQSKKELQIGPLNMKLDGLQRHTQLLKNSNVKNIFNQIKAQKAGANTEKISKRLVKSELQPSDLAGHKHEVADSNPVREIVSRPLLQSSDFKVKLTSLDGSQPRASSNLRITNSASRRAASSDKYTATPTAGDFGHIILEKQKKQRSDLRVSLNKPEGPSLYEDSIFRSFEPSPSQPVTHGRVLFVASTPESSPATRRVELHISKVSNRPQGGYLRTRRLAEVLTENLRISAAVNNMGSHKSAIRTSVQTPTTTSAWHSTKIK